MADGRQRVEVVYALPERQHVVFVELEPGMTVLGAVERSGLLEACAGIDRASLVLGVFGEHVPLDAPAEAGQRIEICRPLHIDPREARRQAVALGAVMGTHKRGDPQD